MSRVKDHNPFGTQKIVSLMFEKEKAHWGPSGKPKISKPRTILNSYRRNMAGILLKRRKTHNQSINQSNELIFTAQVINADIYFLVYIKPISACVLVFSHSQSNQQCLSLKMVNITWQCFNIWRSRLPIPSLYTWDSIWFCIVFSASLIFRN